MKKRSKIIRKDVYRQIGKSKGRFISLFLIVALGVAFYAGIRSCGNDMLISTDTYYDDYNLMDIRIVSTLGLTDDDIDALSEVSGVSAAYGAYSADLLCEISGESHVVKIMSLTEGVNEVVLKEGTMPEAADECIVDTQYLSDYGYEIGDKITLYSGDDTDIDDVLTVCEFTITGTFTSPRYLSFTLGSTQIGSGSLDGLVMVNAQAFAYDYYTEIAIIAEDALELLCYSDEYEELIDTLTDNIDEISSAQLEKRYESIIDEASESIIEAQEELESTQAEAEAELKEAQEELESTQAEAEEELKAAQSTLDDTYADGFLQIEEAQETLDSTYADGLLQIEEAQEELDSTYASALLQIEAAQEELDNTYAAAFLQIEAAQEELDSTYAAALLQIEEAQSLADAYSQAGLSQEAAALQEEIDAQKEALEEQTALAQAEIDAQKAALEEQMALAQAEIDAQKEALEEQTAQAQAEIDAQKEALEEEVEQAQAKIDSSLKTLEEEIAQAQAEIDSSLETLEEEVAQAQAEIDENWDLLYEEIADAREEIDEGWETLYEEIADAQGEIDEAWEEVYEIEEGQWYILDRSYLEDYTSYWDDAKKIENIGKVFPAIFFIVAAMVCLTTMTRMVDEERTQIGTLKALGYGKGTIMAKYIKYALYATLSGSVVGAAIGSIIFPLIIINVYKILYENLEYILTPYNWKHCIVAMVLALVCILAATFAACLKSLMEVPANLMRPASPKKARKLLIERITPLWHVIPFGWKNAFRNFVRYKKRLFMTLFGICGSTALLLVGFGLQDSINSIVDIQYGQLHLYDETVTINTGADEEEMDLLYESLDGDLSVSEYINMYLTSTDAQAEGVSGTLACYVYVVSDINELDNFIIFRDRTTGESLGLDYDTVVISEKMANNMNLKAGDTFTIGAEDEEKKTLTVGAVTENYVYNNIFMSEELYEEVFGQEVEYNQIFVNASEEGIDADAFGEKYLALEAVSSVTNIATRKQGFYEMLSSLDSITLVLIICAAALTFIVLFNLTNINISERRRELATLKVLGFYDIELSQYIYRENFMITIIGIAIGLIIGKYLNSFVITTVEVDLVMFGREIFASSYIMSAVLAFAFAVIVNIIVHFKLKKIDMATSLKSVE